MNITHQESLLYYDCELLFEAADRSGQRYIAAHDDDCRTACSYVVAPATRKDLAAFKAGKIDLRSLLLSAPKGVWYVATMSAGDDSIALTRQNVPIAEYAELPESGYYIMRDYPRHNLQAVSS